MRRGGQFASGDMTARWRVYSFIMADALKQMQPNFGFDRIDIRRAFDVNRERIYEIAAKVYARGRKGSYDLNIADV
jgi:hypothetical protein